MWGVRPQALCQRAVCSALWGWGRHFPSCLRRWQGEGVWTPLGVGRLGPLPQALPSQSSSGSLGSPLQAHPTHIHSAECSMQTVSRDLVSGFHGAFCRPWAPWPRSLQAHPGEAERAAWARLRHDSLGGRQLPACGPGGAGRGGVRLSEAWPVLKSGDWTSGLLSGPLSGGPRMHPQSWKRGLTSPLQPPSPSCRARGTMEATLACSNCPHGPCGPWAGAEEAAGPSPWARAAKV